MKIEQVPSLLTRPLRYKVLWPHKAGVDECFIDIDDREDAIHFAAYSGDVIVGVCSLFEMHTPKLTDIKQYRLRAMATDPDVRGTGAGRALVEAALERVQAMGYDVLWCDARKIALGFYERMGFDRIDEWYDIPQIGPHQLMYYRFSPQTTRE
ncbi:MAG: hypothetical protein RL226_1233 [Bacteroidota bacterium]